MRRFLFATTAVIAAAAAAPAFAAAAASADSGEIIITANKRTERLKDVPVAASVISGDAVAKANATDISDINRLVPSVELKATFNGRVPLAIRGISTNANEGAIGLTSGVAIEIDGVPVPPDSFSYNTLFDIGQVEVLKGPQSTLGGRTASAGVINILTGAPSDHFTGAVSFTGTEDGELRGDARIAGPIMKGVSFSLAGYDSKTPYPVVNDASGVRSEATNYGVRGKLKFEFGENFDATIMGRYSEAKSHGENFVLEYITPGAALFPFIPSAFDANGVPTAFGISQAVGYPGLNIRYGNTHYNSPVSMGSDYKDKDVSATLNYHIGGYTLSSITAYQREDQFQSQDIFESAVYFFDILTGGHAPHFGNVQTANARVTQTSQEFKIASPTTGSFNFIAGAFFSENNVSVDGERVWVANPASFLNKSGTKAYGLYGRATFKVTGSTSIVGGLRYNRDVLSWNKTQFFNPAAGQFQGCQPSGAAPQGCNWNLTDTSSALVGDVSLQQHFGGDAMVYATYSRGYKPKAFNTVHDFISTQAAPDPSDTLASKAVAQEHINDFEIGFKGSLLDHALTFDAAAFYTKYDGYQVQIFDTSAVIGVLRLANGAARTDGIEVDTHWRPTRNTIFSLSAAYINATITSFKGANCFPTQTGAQGCVGGAQDLSGHPLPDSPKFKFNGSAEQVFPMTAFDALIGGDMSYRSSAIFQADGNPQANQPGFALINLHVGVRSKDQRISATLFVNNLTDHFYLTNAEDFFSGAFGFGPPGPTGFGPANVVIGQPARDSHRYFGGRVAVKF